MSDDPDQGKNMGTAVAMAGLALSGLALIGIMSLVIPDISKILLVLMGLLVVGFVQYLVWGWKLDRDRIRDDEENFWDKPDRKR
jgi:xanthine/uracil permease